VNCRGQKHVRMHWFAESATDGTPGSRPHTACTHCACVLHWHIYMLTTDSDLPHRQKVHVGECAHFAGILKCGRYDNCGKIHVQVLVKCWVCCHFTYMLRGSSIGGRAFECAWKKRLQSAHDSFRRSLCQACLVPNLTNSSALMQYCPHTSKLTGIWCWCRPPCILRAYWLQGQTITRLCACLLKQFMPVQPRAHRTRPINPDRKYALCQYIWMRR